MPLITHKNHEWQIFHLIPKKTALDLGIIISKTQLYICLAFNPVFIRRGKTNNVRTKNTPGIQHPLRVLVLLPSKSKKSPAPLLQIFWPFNHPRPPYNPDLLSPTSRPAPLSLPHHPTLCSRRPEAGWVSMDTCPALVGHFVSWKSESVRRNDPLFPRDDQQLR